MYIDEVRMIVLGSIATFVAEDMGSHAIGGFKEVESALRPCHHCLVNGSQLAYRVYNSSCVVVQLYLLSRVRLCTILVFH